MCKVNVYEQSIRTIMCIMRFNEKFEAIM